jgi:uncharacterized protein with PIN domain
MKSYKPKVVVDTSAIVKWFKIEENRESALKLRSWTEEEKIKLVISAILPSECARGLKKRFFHKKSSKNCPSGGMAICFLSTDRQRSESVQAF